MDPKTRHAQLCRQLGELDHAYYVLDAPRTSDRAYDALFDELRRLEAAHPALVHPGSPTQRVSGAPREGVSKVEHAQPMFSLDNTYDEAAVREFDRRVREGLRTGSVVRYVAEPKLDGASLSVVYQGGRLVLGATRGDGRIGEDVTSNVRTVRGLPLTIPDERHLTLRGEVIIHKRDLAAVNEARIARGEEPFANPRNAAAGSLRLLDARQAAERPLRVLFYDVVERLVPTHHQTLDVIAKLGLPTHGLHQRCASVDELLAFVIAFDTRRTALPYETDGVVVKVDDLLQRDLLGATARFPRWAIAYKYAAERVTTVVRDIVVDLGRTGALTPVAVLDPVTVSGSVVARASLHNLDYVADKDVRVGDTVVIEKAGEVIPQVVSVELRRRPHGTHAWSPPGRCPACATEVTRAPDEAALRCPNARCPGRQKALLFYFTRRTGMDIDHLGAALVEQLVDAGLVHDIADVFALHDKRQALLALPRMGEKSCENLLASIEQARRGRTFCQLLTALGIPLLGSVAAGLVAARYRNLRTLLDVPTAQLRAELSELHGIGPKMVDSVCAYLDDPRQRAVLDKLLALGVIAEEPAAAPKVTEGPLASMSLCVTGVLGRPREAVHDAIRRAGGEVHDRVKKGTTYLVIGDKVGDTKLKAARKQGTQILTEAELDAMLQRT